MQRSPLRLLANALMMYAWGRSASEDRGAGSFAFLKGASQPGGLRWHIVRERKGSSRTEERVTRDTRKRYNPCLRMRFSGRI